MEPVKEFLINKRSDLEASSDAFTVSDTSPLSSITSTLFLIVIFFCMPDEKENQTL